jgi:hypothetical protein
MLKDIDSLEKLNKNEFMSILKTNSSKIYKMDIFKS